MQQLNYAIVFVSDMSRALAFYRDVLGLPLKFESPHWSEFANEGSAIALHLADSVNPEPVPSAVEGAANEGHNPAGTCQLGFHVDNLDEVHQRLQSKGVKCLLPPRTEEYGIRQAAYADPDGLRITVAEMVKK